MRKLARSLFSPVAAPFVILGCGLLLAACAPEVSTGSGSGGSATPGSGGVTGSGGNSTTGGAPGSGGVMGSGGIVASGGTPGTGGAVPATGGTTGSGGTAGRGSGGAVGGRGTGGGTAGRGTGGGTAGRGTGGVTATGGTGTAGAGGAGSRFSFFMTSITAMRQHSGNQNGFGGDLRFGEATGLAGADKLCKTIAESSMAGAGSKTWRAFLSAVGPPVVNAIERVGEGPWYDRMGRIVAANKADLMQQRPRGAAAAIINDLPNEFGVPNHNPDGTGQVDNHDVLTGTGPTGMLYSMNLNNTCNDWTNSAATAPAGSGGSGGGMMGGRGNGPWCGHSWPAGSGMNWMSALAEGGCGPGINLMEQGGPMQGVYTVGTGGGYGAIYCLALTP